MITFAPIDPAPGVRIATLDGPFGVDAADYSTKDGSISIPSEYVGVPWRLEYTLAGDMPHEIQWAPEDTHGHLTVPLYGRVQRTPMPAGGGYTITPSNPPTEYTFPRLLTTGSWTQGFAAVASGATVDYDFANGVSLNGAMGRPDPTLGDHALLVDYELDAAGCRVAVGSAALDSAAVQPMMHTVQTPPWDSGRKSVTCTPVDDRFRVRLEMGLGTLVSGLNVSMSKILFGITMSTDMPGLTGLISTPEQNLSGMLLPGPVMQTLLQCPYNVTQLPVVAQPSMLESFPHIVHVQLADVRRTLAVSLVSGMETVLTSAQGAFQVAFPAAIPTQFKLETPNGTVALDGINDQVAVGPANGVFNLTFTPETGTELRVDYYDVVLHRFNGGFLTSERIYTVTSPKVRIEASLLVPGADYVFEVRSYKGRPQAKQGNFVLVDYPYGSAVVFTRTFRAS